VSSENRHENFADRLYRAMMIDRVIDGAVMFVNAPVTSPSSSSHPPPAARCARPAPIAFA